MKSQGDKLEERQLLADFQDALEAPARQPALHPIVAAGIGGFVVLNVGLLLSLPPVLMGRGAPYLPTVASKLDKMFVPLRSHFRSLPQQERLFVDLGSGDGRVVFRAARERLFSRCIGYEINPLLHIFAQSRRYIQAPLYLSSTVFFHKDFWKADLSQADVVAIYGLHPIMKDLGTKMMKELKPGCLVLSNVFAIPGWRPSSLSQDGVHVYIVPDCWGHNDTKPETRKS